MKKTPTTLIILDGLGLADGKLSALGESTAAGGSPRTPSASHAPSAASGELSGGNAVRLARTPRLDSFLQKYASTTLSASGVDVGLLPGQPGESETGHANLGAGRVVPQALPRILAAIRDGSFYQNPVLLKAMGRCRERGTALHLCGLLSDGGVHAHSRFLSALLRMAKEQGVERVWVHPFLDGIDVPDGSGASYLRQAEAFCQEAGVGKIATVTGRFYAMDRDCYWDRIEEVYDAMVYGESARTASDPAEAAEQSRSRGLTDAAMEPVVCDPRGTVSDDDVVVCFNVRADRVRQLARAMTEEAFDGFTRQLFPVTFVSFAECALEGVEEAFPRPPVSQCLGEVLSGLGLTQLRIGESCKRAHLTLLFDGGARDPFPGEDREFVPSARAGEEEPEMAAEQVCAGCVERIEAGAYDFVVVNFANCDVIGHWGDLTAAVRAVEAVDACAGRVVDATLKMGGIAMLVGSHGNAERMLDEAGEPTGVNSTDPVPCILCGAGKRLRPGRLADAAPTLLDVMGLNCPDEMDGRTLILE